MLIRKAQVYSSFLSDTSEAERVLAQSRHFLFEAKENKVAVVIPTYNEKGNIASISSAISSVLPNANIIIVDDNSPDGTGAFADRLAKTNSKIHVLHRKGKRGLGFAYRDAFKFVLDNLDAEYIFEMDADLSHNPQYLPIFVHYGRNYGLVTGSRFIKGVSIKNRTIWRNIVSKTIKWLASAILGLKLTDISTGFKCFRRSALTKIDFDKIVSKGYAFQIEVSYQLARQGVIIKEIPIVFEERAVGVSKMSWGIFFEGVFLVFRLLFQKMMKKCVSKEVKDEDNR